MGTPLRVLMVEAGLAWVPYWLERMDHHVEKWGFASLPLELTPTEYFERNCYVTFMDDEVAGYLLTRWCQENLLWASDYPHANGVWPKSREVIARTSRMTPARQ